MYNQYSNTPQSSPSASFNDRYRPSTKYPQSTVVTQILPSPTSPTKIDGFPEQYTGITQASVSPFPTNSNKYTSPSENQKSENIGQDLPQNFQINSSFQKQTTSTQSFNRDQAILSGRQEVQQTPNQVQTELNNNTPQLSSSQQYNGEIYEYSKPAQSLSTTESNEDTSTLTDNFSQFGQKLRPSIQLQQKGQEIQINGNRGPQNQLAGTGPQQPTNLQGQFDQNKYTQNRISTSDSTQDFNRQQTIPSINLQTTDVKPKLETTKFTSGASAENQPTEYKRPFDFSTRIRPCCQGPSTGQNVKDYRKPIQSQDKTSNFGISAQFGHQDNQKSGVSETSFNTPSIGFRPQTLQTTSQPGGVEGIFGGPRRPPSFDEASGYYY
uniref:Uncharacterized protein n=1 Tax=Papilio xuthus TaxID=66420 RepID=I4DK82_PAPXU|nr:unknown unsecreted protein [Papilio xuthus]